MHRQCLTEYIAWTSISTRHQHDQRTKEEAEKRANHTFTVPHSMQESIGNVQPLVLLLLCQPDITQRGRAGIHEQQRIQG
jgi:hypothetical protein